MFKLGLLVVLAIGFIDCEHFDVKGGHLKGPSFWSSYKAKVVELPSPTIEHIAPIQQRLVLEEKVHRYQPAPVVQHPVQERLVVEEKIHHVEQPQVIEQVRVEQDVKGHLVSSTKSRHENVVLTERNHHDLAHERRHEELHQQREQREQLKEIQHFQQIQQHEQIRQQLEQQKQLEHVVVEQKPAEQIEQLGQIVEGKTNVHHIEQIIQQKQERNEKLTDVEEAVAEPFPLIPKTHFTCDDKPVLPGMYADLETGCRVYHFCFANAEKAEIIQQVHQEKVDILHNDVHHTNSLLISAQPKPEQQQMKSFFCGEGTLFNQKLLICDHAVNVICPDSIHYYSANLEFGKAAPEPAAQLVQQREITKTNHIVQEPIVQVRERIVQPIFQVREQIVQRAEPLKIVQVRERIVEQPVVQVREQIVQHHEPARVQEQQVKIGHLVEEGPVVLQQRKESVAKNEIVYQNREVTDRESFASASDRNPDWRENRSWSTSRTVWGNLGNETGNEINSNSNSTASTTSDSSNRSSSENGSETSSNTSTSNGEQSGRQQIRPINRRFLGEQMTSNIPETKFTCEGKPFDGMYADIETGCKIYHQCLNGRKSTFMCGRGTAFNQAKLSCDFEDRVKCNESQQFYMTNVEFN